MTGINHESHLTWQAQYLVMLECHISWRAHYLVILECDFSWHAQHLLMLECHFSWQAQYWVKSMLGSWSNRLRIVNDTSTVFGQFPLDFGMQFCVARAMFGEVGG